MFFQLTSCRLGCWKSGCRQLCCSKLLCGDLTRELVLSEFKEIMQFRASGVQGLTMSYGFMGFRVLELFLGCRCRFQSRAWDLPEFRAYWAVGVCSSPKQRRC